MNSFYFLCQQTMIFFVPLMVVALGELFSERSGVLNIALEGIMVFGGFWGILFVSKFQASMPVWLCLAAAILISMAMGMLLSLLHAFASINLKADQTISSTALNTFSTAFCIFFARVVQEVEQVSFKNTFRIDKIPLLGDIPVIGPMLFQNAYITTYLGVAILLISSYVLYKTRFGLRLRSCGENPQAADSVGIDVYRMRYTGVLLSGALGGLGGLIYIIPSTTMVNSTVAGYGFLALTVLVFGQWKPSRIFFAALFFGLTKTIAAAYSGIPFLLGLGIPDTIYKMLPYIATLLVLTITSSRSPGPAAAGVPYDKGAR